MNKITLIAKHGRETAVVRFTDNFMPNLHEMLEIYERFLRACGYVFDGQLELVNEDLPNNES